MGLFDNIIGTATEGVEPLGMDTIVDESIPQAGQGGGGTGDGSGGGSSRKKDDNPNVVSGDKVDSIILDQNTPTEIPNIDIGGDIFNFNYAPPTDAALTRTPEAGITPILDSDVSLNSTIPDGDTITNSITEVSSNLIDTDTTITDVNPVEEVINPVTDISPTSIESSSPLIDITTITDVNPVEEVKAESATEVLASTPIEIIDTITPVVEVTEPATPETATTSESTISKTLESLNERISEFLTDLEALKVEEKKLLLEKEAALARIEEEEKIAIAKLEEEKKVIEEAVKKIHADEKKIEETIALLNNNKII